MITQNKRSRLNLKVTLFLSIIIGLILFFSIVSAAPPSSTPIMLERGVDIIHLDTSYTKTNTDLEINFWTYNSTDGRTLTNTSLNCTYYLIDNQGINVLRGSNVAGASFKINYGKGSPLCVNCWTSTIKGGNFSTPELYSYQIKCQGSREGGHKTGTFEVTSSGEMYSESQFGMIVGQGIVIALLIALGFSFAKEKWKLRGFFFVLALFMGMIMLNSIRVLAGSSSILDKMTQTGFIVGIVAVSFMAIYLLIYYTIELFKTIRNKKEMKWQVSNNPN